jgi:hypothetical protein
VLLELIPGSSPMPTTTVNDVARSIPWIYAVVDNKQANHQDLVVEMTGMITKHLVSILIDLVLILVMWPLRLLLSVNCN